MSLYESVASKSLGSSGGGGLFSGISSGISGLGGKAGGMVSGAIGGATGSALGGIAKSAVNSVVNKAIPAGVMNGLKTYGGAVDAAMNGNFDKLGATLIQNGALDGLLGSLGLNSAMGKLNASNNPVFGGVTLDRAIEIYKEHQAVKFEKKNLFLLEVTSPLTMTESRQFNLFALGVDYPTVQITGEKVRLGTANADLIQSSDAIDLSITTYDDKAGTLKNWFKDHASKSAPSDGTATTPSEYALKIKIIHGVIDDGQIGYEDKGWFRAETFSNSLTRQDHGLHEITMNFSQIDTFHGW